MRLIIVRHGETNENAQGIVQGHQLGTISVRGKLQINMLALRMKNEPIDLIFSSDLSRARETTQAIAHFHQVPMIYSKLLRERGAGSFVGYSKEKLRSEPDNFVSDAETVASVRLRASAVLDYLVSHFAGKTVLISSHGFWNKMFLSIVLEKSSNRIAQANCCVNIIRLCQDSSLKVDLLNSSNHLAASQAVYPLQQPR